MKLFSIVFCVLAVANAYGNDKADEAKKFYSERDFNAEGIKNVQASIKLFQEAIAEESDAMKILDYKLELTDGYYFLGEALEKKAERMAAHKMAIDLSEEVMEELGVDSENAHKLSDDEIAELKNELDDASEFFLADAFYSKGASLGQWSRLNGIAASLSNVPVGLGLMDRIISLGYESIHHYGPYRSKGRARYILPKIFGGDLEASEEFLKKATKNTLAQGQRYSVHGSNNIYLAETLYKRGKETQAKRVLDAFIKADFSTLSEELIPENKESLRQAKELAEEWK